MSRRKSRRERREQKRNKNKKEYKIEDIANNEVLYKSFKLSCKGVMFKESVQRYRLNVLFKNYETKQKMLNGEDVRRGLIIFKRNDRGKPRDISSIHFPERVVQKSVCSYFLQPKFFKTLIKENSASQKGKGTHFAAKMLIQHLREFYKKHDSGYILLIDFKKYFENIDHEKVLGFYEKNVKDERLKNLCNSFVTIYEKGLGLGSEVSQFNAIIYLNKIDHYIKSKFKFYGRYMDDSYIIHNDKKELENFLNELRGLYSELKIVLNEKKTIIRPLEQHFPFLKTRHKITKTKKIIKKPCRSCIVRERRRLKRQLKLVTRGVLKISHIKISVASWRGSMLHRNARKSIYEIEKILENFIKIKEEKP